MGWNSDVFFPAFKRAGMLSGAEYVPTSGPAVPFDVDFRRPDQVVLDGMVHTTDYSIEYQSADITLQRDDIVRVDGVTYKVRQTPAAKGDGTFVIALLEEVSP